MLTTPEAADPVVAPAPDASTTMAAPPGAAVAVRAVPRSRARRGRPPAIVRAHAAAWLCLSIFGFAMAIALASFDVPSPMLEILALGSAFVFAAAVLIATVRLLRAAVDVIRAPSDRTPMGALAAVGNLFVAGLGLAVGAMFAYVSTVGFSRGRQLRRFGRVQLPGLRRDQAWASPMSVDMSVPPPPGLADQWRENGKTEHASVAAFARLTLDLMALGAPPALIAAANRDALDEIRHAELCFSLARAIDGRDVGPAPFPQAQRLATLPSARPLALAKLAVDSLVDGALHEGVSARIIARLGRGCEVPEIRDVLKEIAADEGRHSAHGWAVVEWCVREGGVPVREALRGAIHALPRTMRSGPPEAAADGAWERWGIHGRALAEDEYAAALDHVVRRVRAMLEAAAAKAA